MEENWDQAGSLAKPGTKCCEYIIWVGGRTKSSSIADSQVSLHVEIILRKENK